MCDLVKIAETKDGGFAVKSPYNADFVAHCRRLGGKWNGGEKYWAFPALVREQVLAVLSEIYGWKPDSKAVTVKITAKRSLDARRDAIRFAGRVVAEASGRDTGARLGADVIMLDGKINSGGSMKNWETYIYEGSVFIMRNVPDSAALADDDWDVEVVQDEQRPDIEALKAEKEKLLKRLAQIEKWLAEAESAA